MTQDASGAVALEKVYAEIRTGIRETDNISFKLLGLVPLVSGTALIALILQTRELPSDLVGLLALFAASVTLGLFRWELRNIQTCSWLIKFSEAIEAHALATRGMSEIFRTRPSPPQRIGKTEAEKLMYTTTIVAWLALPFSLGGGRPPSHGYAYGVLASAVLLGALVSLIAKPRVAPEHGSDSTGSHRPGP
jgi:hypothetical protein